MATKPKQYSFWVSYPDHDDGTDRVGDDACGCFVINDEEMNNTDEPTESIWTWKELENAVDYIYQHVDANATFKFVPHK